MYLAQPPSSHKANTTSQREPQKGYPPKYPRVTHRLHLHLFNPLTHSPLHHQLTLDMTATLPEASSSRLDESRYTDIDTVLDRKGGWTEEHFVGGQAVCPPQPRFHAVCY
jgi:hypothetical protein